MNKEYLEAILCTACVFVDSQCYAADVVAAISCQILCSGFKDSAESSKGVN